MFYEIYQWDKEPAVPRRRGVTGQFFPLWRVNLWNYTCRAKGVCPSDDPLQERDRLFAEISKQPQGTMTRPFQSGDVIHLRPDGAAHWETLNWYWDDDRWLLVTEHVGEPVDYVPVSVSVMRPKNPNVVPPTGDNLGRHSYRFVAQADTSLFVGDSGPERLAAEVLNVMRYDLHPHDGMHWFKGEELLVGDVLALKSPILPEGRAFLLHSQDGWRRLYRSPHLPYPF